MTPGLFTKRTLSNMASNIAALLILAVFVVLFLRTSPWQWTLRTTLLSYFLTLFPLVLLAILTMVTRHKLSDDEASDDDILPP